MQEISSKGQAYLQWLQDRGFYWYTAKAPALRLLFLCEGSSLTEDQAQLLQRMGQAIGLSPKQFQSLCMETPRKKTLAETVHQLQPSAILVLGTCPAFLATPSQEAKVPRQATWSLQDLLEFPLRKKDTWAALLALKENWG